jgi:ribonuclease HI
MVVVLKLSLFRQVGLFLKLNRLDHDYTNNQTEYEALLFGLEILHDLGVKHVEAYGDSLLVV